MNYSHRKRSLDQVGTEAHLDTNVKQIYALLNNEKLAQTPIFSFDYGTIAQVHQNSGSVEPFPNALGGSGQINGREERERSVHNMCMYTVSAMYQQETAVTDSGEVAGKLIFNDISNFTQPS